MHQPINEELILHSTWKLGFLALDRIDFRSQNQLWSRKPNIVATDRNHVRRSKREFEVRKRSTKRTLIVQLTFT
jgi:hypothetical protein